MSISADALNSLAAALQAVAGPSVVNPGETVLARLLPTSGGNVALLDLAPLGPLNLDATLAEAGVTQTLTGVLSGVAAPVSVPVSFKAEWWVTDADDNPLDDGHDYVSLDGAGGANASFLLRPDIVELTNPLDAALAAPTTRHIWVDVTLSAGGAVSAPQRLGPIVVQVLPLQIPTVLVLCQHSYFHGQAFVIVPPDSAITGVEVLKDVLENLRPIVVTLARLPAFASFLLGLDSLAVAIGLPAVFKVARVTADGSVGVESFERPYLPDGAEPDDRMSSLVFVAGYKRSTQSGGLPAVEEHRTIGVHPPSHIPPPGALPRSVQCFVDGHFGGASLVVSPQHDLAVMILDLRDAPLFSLPAGHLKICGAAADANFNDKISSVRFEWGFACP